MVELTARRAVLGSVLAGAVLTGGADPATAARGAAGWRPRMVPADQLRPGDVVVGPHGHALRVAQRRRLASGRIRLRVTDPTTGRVKALDPVLDRAGMRPGHRMVVLVRGVPASAVSFSSEPDPVENDVVDGGRP